MLAKNRILTCLLVFFTLFATLTTNTMLASAYSPFEHGDYRNQDGKGFVFKSNGNNDGFYFDDGFGSKRDKMLIKISPNNSLQWGINDPSELAYVTQKDNESYAYYVKNGKVMHGWIKESGKWYCFGATDNGVSESGMKRSSVRYYHGGIEGYLIEPYQVYESFALRTGWVKDQGKWYYCDKDMNGAMVTGWKKINSKWYYFNTSGAMKTGWLKDNGKWYYLENSGAMLSNTSKKIGDKTYNFNKSGVCTNP